MGQSQASTPGPARATASRPRRGLAWITLLAVTWTPIITSTPALATDFSPPLINLYDSPFLVGERIPPQVMLTITKDQQLFKKAYDDFSDIDGDGLADTEYRHSIDYYGYFDPQKCYTYVDGSKRFEPQSVSSSKYCVGQWSGNFLNWATMTRMDALRKVLFGGLRSPDRSNGDGSGITDGDAKTGTVLERAYLPNDAHSFTKYYDRDDVGRLTPFSPTETLITGVTPHGSNGVAIDNRSVNANDKFVELPSSATAPDVGEWVQLTAPNGSFVRGKIASRSGTGNRILKIDAIKPASLAASLAANVFVKEGTAAENAAAAGWTLTLPRRRGITICNTTDGEYNSATDIQASSETNTNLPRMRVARGNYSLWNAQERWQCRWGTAANNNNPSASGLMAYPGAPSQASAGLDAAGKGTTTGQGDYFVRVQVCKSNLIGSERCKQYPAGNYKPVGVLQSFGETDRIRFGLITGSYKRNLSGGVLRKNISRLDDEIDVIGTGQFKNLPAAGVPATAAPGDPALTVSGGSIIRTLSLLRLVGYRYKSSDSGAYFGGSNDDKCPYQRALDKDGECKSWGNPMSEMYYESLRYFAGQTTPTAAFQADDSTVIANLATAKWPTNNKAVLSTKNYCAPLNVLVVNGAVSTNETDDQIGSVAFMENASGQTAKSLTNQIGAAWGLSGAYYFGHVEGSSSTSTGYDICSGKSLTGLGEAIGICPEGPTLKGSYLMAGLAYHAHTNKIRTDITLPTAAARLKRQPLKVDTYGVSIAGGIPRIPVKFKGEKTPRVIIQPAYRLTNGTYGGGGSLVDARIIRQVEEDERSYGTIMVSWEDSEAGGDYDMDVWGTITYELVRATNRISVTTDTVYKASANPQGFGYVISGTGQDGLHFHSGVYQFNYTDPTPPISVTGGSGNINASGGCSKCEDTDDPSTATYSLSTSPPAKALEDPLYYASLFGGFHDANGDGVPNQGGTAGGVIQPSEYDKRNNATGVDAPDGIPDNYFRVDNPLGLEMGLERTFQIISEQSSLASLQASATRIVAGTAVYQATFNSGDWSGSFESLPIYPDGRIGVANWNAATVSLAAGNTDPQARRILTIDSATRQPIAFQYSALSSDQKTALRTLPGGVTDTRGQERLDYLRGDQSQEGVGVQQFRRRVSTVLGDIVNSGPIFVGKPQAGIADASYLAFIAANQGRTPIVYVGSNDGMLHAFNATNGTEAFAYVPSPVYSKLSRLTTQDYQHEYTVDGQMSSQDVQIGQSWRTYLVGGLGAGGQGVFALDVTDPSAASEQDPGKIVKWEFTDHDDAAMGYLLSAPILRKLANGDWVAIFSSGYNAEYKEDGRYPGTGRAAIFMLKLSGPTEATRTWVQGTNYWKIELPTGTAGEPNGVGGVASFDADGDGTADYLYAGDLTGAIWRVRLPSATGDWAPTAQTIFKAVDANNNPQPITAPLALSVGPNYTGVFIAFGTGKLLEPSDLKPASGGFASNSLYGIWDKKPENEQAEQITRSSLMAQKILTTEGNQAYGSGDNGAMQFSLLSAYIPNYTETARTNVVAGSSNPLATGPTATTPPNQRGWSFDVPSGSATGERTIYRPETVGSFSIFVNAMPSAESCEGGGSEAQYAVETLTGGRSNFGGFDRDANGKIQGSSGDLLGDQSTFGLAASNGGQPQTFFASRRETSGGFGQMSIMKSTVAAGGAGAASSCDGAGLAPYSAQSYSTGLIGTQRLPGGCIGRVQWRELVTH